jgi:processive 1,2-diacylglycerol beta-glucosyltransferase
MSFLPAEKENKPIIQSLVAYTADPWESALPVLRYLGPAQVLGWKAYFGNQGAQADTGRLLDADVVLIQRDFPRFSEAFAGIVDQARRLKKPIIYDLDDMLFDLPDGHPLQESTVMALFPMLWAAMQADMITTTTVELQAYLRQFNENVVVLPNYLNDRLWPLRDVQVSKASEGVVVIGFMGGQTHQADLDEVVPVLRELLDQYQGRVRLRIWGCLPPQQLLERAEVEWIPMDILDYGEFVRTFSEQHCDIFIAPLSPVPFNRYKSPIKFLEYSAMGIPGIYSRETPYLSVVDHTRNGCLAGNLGEWKQCLARLIDNPELRIEMGQAALMDVRRKWLLTNNAAEWQAAYDAAAQSAQKAQIGPASRTAEVARISGRVRERLIALESQRDQLRQEAQTREDEARFLRAQLDEIYRSRSWKTIQKVQKLRLRLAPPESRREALLKKIAILSARSRTG